MLVGSALSGGTGCGKGREHAGERPVVFVCEHGAAKSVIAAALFNARASARNLPFRAESRGVVPDPNLLPQAVAGLRADGLNAGPEVPVRVAPEDIDSAMVVVAFDPLPPDLAAKAPTQLWKVPPVSVDYGAARDAMIPRIDALLDDLAHRHRRERSNEK